MIGQKLTHTFLISSVLFFLPFRFDVLYSEAVESTKKAEASKEDVTVDPFDFFAIDPVSMGADASASKKDAGQSKPPYISAYFSPTCGHCSSFFSDQLPIIREKYINTHHITFGFRPFCHHPLDFAVTQLSLCRGKREFIALFTRFMTGQNEWIEFVVIPEKETEKRAESIKKMLDRLPDTFEASTKSGTLTKSEMLVKFNINESNQKSSVILFALSIGMTIDEIDQALYSTDANEIYSKLIVTTTAAKDDKGNPVAGIPAFYIDGAYEEDPLKASKDKPEEDDFDSIIKTGARVKKKEVAQTPIRRPAPKAKEVRQDEEAHQNEAVHQNETAQSKNVEQKPTLETAPSQSEPSQPVPVTHGTAPRDVSKPVSENWWSRLMSFFFGDRAK